MGEGTWKKRPSKDAMSIKRLGGVGGEAAQCPGRVREGEVVLGQGGVYTPHTELLVRAVCGG